MANYQQLKAAIDQVIKANGQKEITGPVLNDTLKAIVNSLGAGYQFMGVATPSTNPGTPDQNVFYIAGQAGTYTNFNSTVLPNGLSVLKWNGSWSGETVLAGDGVFDISAYKATGGTLATFANLSAALDGGNNIPSALRKGGMSVKFIQGSAQSSDNKYVQFRLMSDIFNTTVANWQGVDDVPTAGSDNLVKSGGVASRYGEAKGYTESGADIASSIVELYLYGDGIDLTHKYVFDRIDRRATPGNYYRFFIKDKTTDTVVIAYSTQNIEPTGVIELTPENNSGVYGKVIINWDRVVEGVYNLNLDIPLTYKVFDTEYSSTIKCYALDNALENEIARTTPAVNIANRTDYIQISDVWIDNQFFSTYDGIIVNSENYARTDYIPAFENCTYDISGYAPGSVICFNANKVFLGEATYDESTVFQTLPNTAYIGVNFNKAVQPSDYKENGIILTIGTHLTHIIDSVVNGNNIQKSNILSGKKWCVVGDSFSEYSEEQFTDGPFIGRYVTYKYLIAERNNMDIVDMTMGGRTMAYPNDHTFDNAFAKPSLYQSIPSDVDYITIMLGINDGSHYAGYSPDGESTQGYITLGTIDSVDTGSFYGAWNVVLDWIFTNRPYAHVGILITNGMGDQYGEASEKQHQLYQAILDICQKWNVPHINLNGGDGKTPMMQRGIYPEGTPASLIASKWNAFAISPTGLNGHTNAKGHRYESTFIENFLRSI